MAEYEMQELSLPNGEGKRVLYPRMVIRQQASLEQIAERIQHASTYSKGEIIGLVQELARQIAAEMAEGKSVKIDGLGVFTPALGLRKDKERETGEEGSRYGIPLSFGAGIKLIFTPKWSMSVGLNYTFLSRTFDGIYVDAEQTPARISLYEDIRNVQNYIGIPVNFYYSIVSKDFIDFYTYAGGTAEYCLTNRYSAENEDGPLYFKDKAGSMQFSANIGIGVEFNITDYMGIYIDPSLRYYFRNSNAPKSIRTAQPLMLGFEAGLRFRL